MRTSPPQAGHPSPAVRRTTTIPLAAVIVLTAASLIWAQDAPDLTQIGIEAVMNMEVTSVSKRPERRMDAAAAVYVITQDDIRRSGATSIPEALRLAPGLQVARIDANKWAIGVRGFASRLSRSLLVLIDGRSVYSPLFAGVYWEVQDTLLEDVDRIEVIRGPGATVWGANAVNGVINIITKRAQETQGSLVSLGDGEKDRSMEGARFGGKTAGGFSYRGYGKGFSREAEFHETTPDFDTWHMSRAGFRADRDLERGGGLTVQGDVYGGRSGQSTVVSSYSAPYSTAVEEDADFSGGNLLGRWSHHVSEASDTSLQIYLDRTRRREPVFEENRDTFDLEFQQHTRFASRHDLVWGLGYRLTSGDTSGVPTIEFSPPIRTDYVLNAFVQDEIGLVPSKVSLTLGSKFEVNDYSGFNYQPSVRLLVQPSPRQSVWASISRALRVPSRIEHDLTLTALLSPATPTFIRLFGSDGFRPEELVAYEVGYRIEPASRLLLDLSAFYNNYDDLLSLEPGAPFTETSPSPSHTIVPLFIKNKMGARVGGVELLCDWRPASTWRLVLSHSLLSLNMQRASDSLDSSTEASTEGSSPRNQTSLQSYLDLPHGFEFDLVGRRIDRLPALSVDGYADLDASFRWRPNRNLELSILGFNLLAPHHLEFGGGSAGLTEIERSLQGRVVWRW